MSGGRQLTFHRLTPTSIDPVNQLNFPPELLLEIFSHLTPEDLLNIASIRKDYRDLIFNNSEMFWKRKFQQYFPASYQFYNTQVDITWCQKFQQRLEDDALFYKVKVKVKSKIKTCIRESDTEYLSKNVSYEDLIESPNLVKLAIDLSRKSVLDCFFQIVKKHILISTTSTLMFNFLKLRWAIKLHQPFSDAIQTYTLEQLELAIDSANDGATSKILLKTTKEWDAISASNLLKKALESGSEKIILLLLDFFGKKNLITATFVENINCEQSLFRKFGNIPLSQECLDQIYLAIKKVFTKSDGSIDTSLSLFNMRTILYWAITLGQRTLEISFLIENGSNVTEKYNGCNTYPIILAARTGNLEAVEVLLKKDDEAHLRVDVYNQNALIWSASSGYSLILNRLITRQFQVTLASKGAATIQGKTALHWAAQYGYTECVRELIAAGANPCTKDSNGNQPIHDAASNGRIDVITYLLRQPTVQSNPVNINGSTPFDLAAENDKFQSAKYLFDQGAIFPLKPNKNQQTFFLRYPLWKASCEKYQEDSLFAKCAVKDMTGITDLMDSSLHLFLKKRELCINDGRIKFENISVFQYHLWSLEQRMLQLYLQKAKIIIQNDPTSPILQEFNLQLREHFSTSEPPSYVKKQGISLSFAKIIEVLNKYIELQNINSHDDFKKEYAAALSALPSYSIHEYKLNWVFDLAPSNMLCSANDGYNLMRTHVIGLRDYLNKNIGKFKTDFEELSHKVNFACAFRFWKQKDAQIQPGASLPSKYRPKS